MTDIENKIKTKLDSKIEDEKALLRAKGEGMMGGEQNELQPAQKLKDIAKDILDEATDGSAKTQQEDLKSSLENAELKPLAETAKAALGENPKA